MLVLNPMILARVLGLVVVFTILASPCRSTTIASTNLAQLSEQAEKAFVVKIQAITVGEVKGKPCDVITGTVTEPVFGNVNTSETITWNQFRFSANVPLPGMPRFQVDQEYLVFLSGPGAEYGFKAPIGLGQGSFLVYRNVETGQAYVRNAYRNSTLSSGLNMEKVAEDIVSSDKSTRGLPSGAKTKAVEMRKMQLRGGPSASLDGVKRAALFFRQKKIEGSAPSLDYRTTTTSRVLH